MKNANSKALAIWQTQCVPLLENFCRRRIFDLETKSLRMSQTDYQLVYNTAYEMAVDTKDKNFEGGQKIYKYFQYLLQKVLKALETEVNDANGIYQIKRLNLAEQQYMEWLGYLTRLFSIVDRTYVKDTKKPPLYLLGVEKFRDCLLLPEKVSKLNAILMSSVKDIRQINNNAHVAILNNFLLIFSKLAKNFPNYQTIIEEFKENYVVCCGQHYQKIYVDWAKLNHDKYCQQVMALFTDENQLASRFFGSDAPLKKIREVFIQILIRKYKFYRLIRSNGWLQIWEKRITKYLSRICELMSQFNETDGLKEVYEKYYAQRWTNFMKKAVIQMNKLPTESQKIYLFKKIAEFYGTQLRYVQKHTYSLPFLTSTFKIILQNILAQFNRQEYQTSSLILHYWQWLLNVSALTEDEKTQEVLKILNIFECIHDKEQCTKRYQQQLSEEMISKPSINVKLHKFLAQGFMKSCGSQIQLNRFIEQYEKNLQNLPALQSKSEKYKIKINLRLFKQDSWPFDQMISTNMKFFHAFQAMIDIYVGSIHKNSKVRFQRFFGWMVIEIKNSSLTNVVVSDFQGHLLQQLDQKKKLTMAEILEIYKEFPEEVVCRQLRCLTEHSQPLLLQNQDTFTINFQVSSSQPISYLSNRLNKAAVNIQTSQDLTLRTRGFIVRHMKMFKVMQEAQLVEKIMGYLKNFRPELEKVNACIDALIDDKFLERKFQKDITEIKYCD